MCVWERQDQESSLSAYINFAHWLSKLRSVKILIRLRECASWSDSSFGGIYAQKYIFWRYSSCNTYILMFLF